MPYSNSYNNSIVVFLDVLGFKNKILSAKTDSEVKEIFNILTYIKAWNTSDGENSFIEAKDFCNESYVKLTNEQFKQIQKDLHISYFSDSLVITWPYEDKDLNTKLFLIIRSLAYLISKLAGANFFTRGGISIGEMFYKDNIFFGPAFLESYKLESEIAIYPRIILSDKLSDIANTIPYVKQDNDGVLYVDWVNFIKENINNQQNVNNQQFKTIMANIKNWIDNNINENKSNFKIRTKYEWLKNQI